MGDAAQRPQKLGTKPLALIAYLAVEGGQRPRDELASLLWSESTPDQARASLRQALKQVRAAVGPHLAASRTHVGLDPAVAVDVREFLDACSRQPDRAAEFGVPLFLTGFAPRNAPGFDDWADRTRNHLLRTYRKVLCDLARDAMARSHWREAASQATRWQDSDPLSDDAVRTACEALYMSGDRGSALARYEDYRRRLDAETGAAPSAALRSLIERIAGEAPVLAAGAVGGATFPEPTFEPGFIGRERQWQAFAAAWSDVERGRCRILLLEGEAGVGKSRLADTMNQWLAAEGATVLRGRGYDADGIPFTPVVEAIRHGLEAPGLATTAPEWLAEVTRMLPELRDRYPGLPLPTDRQEVDRRWRLFEAVAQVVMGLASERPTVLCIDDVERCDAESCALLHFLAGRIEDAPVLLILSLTLGAMERSAPAARLCRALRTEDRTTAVPVTPLTQEQLWQLIREMGNITAPDGAKRFAAQIYAVTDGNPFHVMELLKTLFAKGILEADATTREWVARPEMADAAYEPLHMPRTVQDAITDRCARLSDEQRDLLATVAVAGRQAATDLLSHVHGISRLHAAAVADQLVDKRLLAEEDGAYRCAHPVIHDVVRATLTPARTRALHREIALSLERLADAGEVRYVGEIARHATRGGERHLAHRRALDASDYALTHFAFEESLSWLDLAATTAEGREADEVNERTARVLEQAGWSTPPAGARRAGTPARGIARRDLDLRVPDPL